MLDWTYYLTRVRAMLGVKVLTNEDQSMIREAYEVGHPPELAADEVKLVWLGYESTAEPQDASQ